MIDKNIVIEEYEKLMDELYRLRDAWDNYHSEPFMLGKVEAANVFISDVIKAFNRILEIDDE